MLITEYDEATQLLPDNVLIQDGPGGDEKDKRLQFIKMASFTIGVRYCKWF